MVASRSDIKSATSEDRYQDQYQDQQPEPVAAEPAPPSWMRAAANSGWQQHQAPAAHPAAQPQAHYPAEEQAQQYQEQEYDDRPAFLRNARPHDPSRYDDVLYDQNSQNAASGLRRRAISGQLSGAVRSERLSAVLCRCRAGRAEAQPRRPDNGCRRAGARGGRHRGRVRLPFDHRLAPQRRAAGHQGRARRQQDRAADADDRRIRQDRRPDRRRRKRPGARAVARRAADRYQRPQCAARGLPAAEPERQSQSAGVRNCSTDRRRTHGRFERRAQRRAEACSHDDDTPRPARYGAVGHCAARVRRRRAHRSQRHRRVRRCRCHRRLVLPPHRCARQQHLRPPRRPMARAATWCRSPRSGARRMRKPPTAPCSRSSRTCSARARHRFAAPILARRASIIAPWSDRSLRPKTPDNCAPACDPQADSASSKGINGRFLDPEHRGGLIGR